MQGAEGRSAIERNGKHFWDRSTERNEKLAQQVDQAAVYMRNLGVELDGLGLDGRNVGLGVIRGIGWKRPSAGDVSKRGGQLLWGRGRGDW